MGQSQLLLLNCISFLVTLSCNLEWVKGLIPSKVMEVTEQELMHALCYYGQSPVSGPAQSDREEQEGAGDLKWGISKNRAQLWDRLTQPNSFIRK